MAASMFWPKAIFTLSIVMQFRRALQRTMNMAFSQSTETFTRTWGVAPGYGEQRPLANNALTIRERNLTTDN
jgi:hypothetical protein